MSLQHFLKTRGPQISQKSESRIASLGARMVTGSTFHTKNPQVLGTTAQNFVSQVVWYLEFEHPC